MSCKKSSGLDGPVCCLLHSVPTKSNRKRNKMMNVVALALTVSSLAVAGVWSPYPAIVKDHQHTSNGAGVIKEGHRVIVIEYERSVVSPENQPQTLHPSVPGVFQEATEKAKEAASVLPNVGQGISTPAVEEEVGKSKNHPAREKICDAFGVCRDKIGGLFGKSKEKAEHVVKDTAAEVGRKAVDGKEKVKEKAEDVRDKVGDAKEKAMDAKEKVKDKAEDVIREMGQTKDEIKENVSAARKNLTDILRRGKEVVLDAMAYAKAPEMLRSVLSVVELLGFATAYGTCMWVTFVSSHVLVGALTRQQLGVVQSKIYPVYFQAMACSIGLAFLAHFFGTSGRWQGPVAERVQGFNFLALLGLVLANMLFLEPTATKVMLERMKMEKEEGRGRDMEDVLEPTTTGRTSPEQEAMKNQMLKLNKRLKNLNSYSSFLNVLTLMGLTWHLVHLSRRLQGVC